MGEGERFVNRELDVYAIQRLLDVGKLLKEVVSKEEMSRLKSSISAISNPIDGEEKIGNAGVS